MRSSGNPELPNPDAALCQPLIFGKSFAPFLLAAGYNQWCAPEFLNPAAEGSI